MALGFEMIFGKLVGTPVAVEVWVNPVEAEEAVMRVPGSHMEVALFVPVGRIVCGCVVGAELNVEVASTDVICCEEAEVAVAIVVPLLVVVSDASEEAEVAEEPDAVVRETVVSETIPELDRLTTTVELTEALEISLEPDVAETVTLVGAEVGGAVTEAMVLLLVGGTTVEIPVSLLFGAEVTTLDKTLEDVGMLVGGPVIPSLVDEGGCAVVVTGTELLEPKMLEIMLPRSVVGLEVGLETRTSEVVIGGSTPVEATPVEAGPVNPDVVVSAELEITVDPGSTEEATEDAESVEALTEDAESVEVGRTVEITDETSEAIEETNEDNGSAVVVGADEATLESVVLTETAESVADVFDAIESVPVVTEAAEDATLESAVVIGAEELVGETTDDTSELTSENTELSKDGMNPRPVEVEAAAVEPPVPVNEIPDVVVAGAVDPPVPVNETPEETSISELETVGAVDPAVPVKETPEVSEVGVAVAVAVAASEEVEVDPKTPPGPNVIALPELEAEDAAEESSLVDELAVGVTMVAG